MNQLLRWGLAFAAVLTMLTPSAVSAQNFYVAIRGGPGATPDLKAGVVGFEETQEFSTGFTASGAVGYSTSFGLRFDGEFGYIWAPLKSDGGVSVGGSLKNYLLMANAYYDLKLPFLGGFKPYIGFGIGGARINADRQIFAEATGLKYPIDEWRTAFAYQGRIGVGYDVNKWLDLSLGYRYVHIEGGTWRDTPKVVTDGMNNHSIEFGAAVKF